MVVDVDRGVMKLAVLGDSAKPLGRDPGQLSWRSEQPQQAERNGHNNGHGDETRNLFLEWGHATSIAAITGSQRWYGVRVFASTSGRLLSLTGCAVAGVHGLRKIPLVERCYRGGLK